MNSKTTSQNAVNLKKNELLVEQFKDFYRDLIEVNLDGLKDLYTADIFFKDPVLELNKREKLHKYLSHSCSNLSFCEFIYQDQIIGENSAYLKWDMRFSHPRLGKGIINVRGISHIKFNEKIFYHEDSYDVGAMLYQHIPLLKSAVKFINNRLVV